MSRRGKIGRERSLVRSHNDDEIHELYTSFRMILDDLWTNSTDNSGGQSLNNEVRGMLFSQQEMTDQRVQKINEHKESYREATYSTKLE